MSGPDWVRWYPNRWITGTIHLNLEQRGFFIQVVSVIMDLGECDADDGYLARICGCNRQRARRLKNELINIGKMYESCGKLRQNRAETERKLAIKLAEKGADLAAKRWKHNGLANATQQCQPQPHKRRRLRDSDVEQELPFLESESSTDSVYIPPNGGDTNTPKKRAKRREMLPIPDDWEPDVEFARSKGLSDPEINRQANKLVDWAKANGKRYCDWTAVWRNWVRSYLERQVSH